MEHVILCVEGTDEPIDDFPDMPELVFFAAVVARRGSELHVCLRRRLADGESAVFGRPQPDEWPR